jgi:hypothetical protein
MCMYVLLTHSPDYNGTFRQPSPAARSSTVEHCPFLPLPCALPFALQDPAATSPKHAPQGAAQAAPPGTSTGHTAGAAGGHGGGVRGAAPSGLVGQSAAGSEGATDEELQDALAALVLGSGLQGMAATKAHRGGAAAGGGAGAGGAAGGSGALHHEGGAGGRGGAGVDEDPAAVAQR